MANVIEIGNEVIIAINDPCTGEPCAIHTISYSQGNSPSKNNYFLSKEID